MENMNSDEYSSVKDFYEELILNTYLFEKEISKMNESELIHFYDYVVRKFEDEPRDVVDPLWGVVIRLEMIPCVNEYKNNRESIDVCLTDAERQEIDDTVRYLEAKRKINPLRKLIKYIRS